jgi:hypothetical protein
MRSGCSVGYRSRTQRPTSMSRSWSNDGIIAETDWPLGPLLRRRAAADCTIGLAAAVAG